LPDVHATFRGWSVDPASQILSAIVVVPLLASGIPESMYGDGSTAAPPEPTQPGPAPPVNTLPAGLDNDPKRPPAILGSHILAGQTAGCGEA
jgi:hypothetical protein